MEKVGSVKEVIQKHYFLIVTSIIFSGMYSGSVVYTTNQLESLINYVNREQKVNWNKIYFIIAGALLAALFLYLSKILTGIFSAESIQIIRNAGADKVLSMSYEDSQRQEGALLTRLLSDVNELHNFLSKSLPNLFNNLILVTVIYIKIFLGGVNERKYSYSCFFRYSWESYCIGKLY